MRPLLELILLYVIGISCAKCQQAALNLKRDLFKNYDPQSRPVENSSQITNVCTGLYVLQIVGLSEKSQIMSVNIQLVFIWGVKKEVLLKTGRSRMKKQEQFGTVEDLLKSGRKPTIDEKINEVCDLMKNCLGISIRRTANVSNI